MAKAFFNKRNTFFVLVLLVMCLLSGCGGRTQKEEADKQEEDKLRIGFSFDSFLIERWEPFGQETTDSGWHLAVLGRKPAEDPRKGRPHERKT